MEQIPKELLLVKNYILKDNMIHKTSISVLRCLCFTEMLIDLIVGCAIISRARI